MKLGKAIAAAVGTAAAVGAAVYAKRRLDESQTPLKKQKSVTVWKSGEVQHKEVIKKAVSEDEQTDILKSRINMATRHYEPLSDRDNETESDGTDETVNSFENEQKIAPVNFTFIQSDEDSNTGVSFDRVFDHFNRLEKPFEEENENVSESIVDTIPANTATAEEPVDETQEDVANDDEYEAAAIAAVTAMREEQETETDADAPAFRQMPLEKGIMTPEPIASAVRELADIPSVTDDVEIGVSTERVPVDDSIFDLSVSEPVEEAVRAFEEISESEEQEEPEVEEVSESNADDMAFGDIEDDLSDDISSVRTAESVEDAVKEFSDLIGEPEAAQSMINDGNDYDDDLEQTGDILTEELSVADDQPVMQAAETEKPRTMDFFDLPDEAYAPVQVAEEKHDENVAEVEDLFGDLLMEDEPVEKKSFSDPSEVFSMFDTADAGQDDFDKYNDEKIEEESEKKKTTDTRKFIAQDIADNIASFAQLLEPLNAVKENKIRSKSGILFDWEMRIQALIGDLPIKTYWRNNFRNYEIWTDEKCMEKAGELLSMLELVGIVRDKAKEVVIDKDTLDFYSAQSEHLNNDLHIGETVVVTRPCWKINGKPARKGEIAKKAPFAEFSRKKVSPLETMLRENSCSDGDVNIPVTEDNFCTYDREIPYVKQAISEGFCKCAVRRMEDGGALAFFYEVIAEGENAHYSPCTLRFEVNIDKNAKVVGRFRSEKV